MEIFEFELSNQNEHTCIFNMDVIWIYLNVAIILGLNSQVITFNNSQSHFT